MSIMQRMTLIGLYNRDDTLFDNVTLPEGYDKDTLIETLLLEHGEKCVMYPEPDFMKYSLGVVSRKWQRELERIYDALMADYNPIWNYDRNEELEDHRGKKWGEKTDADFTDSTTYNSTQTRKPQLTEKNTQMMAGYTKQDPTDLAYTKQDPTDLAYTKQDPTDLAFTQQDPTNPAYTEQDSAHKNVTETKKSAYNSTSYEPDTEVTTDAGKINTSVGKVETSVGKVESSVGKVESSVGKVESSVGKVETSDGQHLIETGGQDENKHTGNDKTNTKGTLSDKNGSETENSSHSAHLWGNIGVTTSAAMVLEETELRMKANLYGIAARIFANELLLNIY